MNRKQLFNLLKILISLALLFFIFRGLDLAAFMQAVSTANPFWLSAGLAMMMLGVVIRAYRWQILLNAIGVVVPIKELTAIWFIGFLFNNLLPSGLGGDAIRIMELNHHSKRGSDAVTSVLVDRFLGLLALQAIALVALMFNWNAVPAAIAYFSVAIFVSILIAGCLLINPGLYRFLQTHIGLFRRLTDIKTISNLFTSFQQYPLAALSRSFGVAIIFNISLIAMNYFIGLGLGAEATLSQYAVFVPITSLVLLLPISFGGLGVREGTYQQLFGQIGVSPETAVALSLLIYFFGNICTGFIGSIIYLLRSARSVVWEKG